MNRMLATVLLVLSANAFASELDVPLNGRAPLKSKKAIHEVTVRDPSLMSVFVSDGTVSLEGRKSGMSAVTIEYADGELERMLVVVGDGQNSAGMSAEQAKTIDVKQGQKAQAKTLKERVKSAL